MKRLTLLLPSWHSVSPLQPRRADFAVVQMEDGWCKVWWGQRRHTLGRRLDKNCGWASRLAGGVGGTQHRPVARRVPVAGKRTA